MSFTGIKSAGTILGSHEWQLDELENFIITFWEKPTFSYYCKFLHTIKVGKSLLQVSGGGGASKIASGLVTSRFSSIWPKYEPFKLWFIRNLSHVQKVNKSITV